MKTMVQFNKNCHFWIFNAQEFSNISRYRTIFLFLHFASPGGFIYVEDFGHESSQTP